MNSIDGFILETHIAVVSRPGYYHYCERFVTAMPETHEEGFADGPCVYFAGELLFQGIVPAKVVTLLGECFVSGPNDYERWKSNSTREHRPYRGMGPGMQQLSYCVIFLVVLFLGLMSGAAFLGFGVFTSILVGFLLLALLLWCSFLPTRISLYRLDKKFTKLFIEILKEDTCWQNNREEVIAALHKVAALPIKRGENNPRTFVSGAKKVLKLLI